METKQNRERKKRKKKSIQTQFASTLNICYDSNLLWMRETVQVHMFISNSQNKSSNKSHLFDLKDTTKGTILCLQLPGRM